MVDRQIPDVWNIFEISSYGSNNPSHQDKEIISKWRDRSSACDRPRNYDKFYDRLPWTCVTPTSPSPAVVERREERESEEDGGEASLSSNKKKSKKKKRGELNYSRTVTERDVKHIERHLSMKKTIRKKIMRDLQQAFVPDPEELSKNEIKMNTALNFDPKRSPAPDKSDKLLDLLRDSDDSGVVQDDDDAEKSRKFKSCRERSTSRLPPSSDGGSSTDDNASDQQQQFEQDQPDSYQKKEKKSFWQMFTGKKKKS